MPFLAIVRSKKELVWEETWRLHFYCIAFEVQASYQTELLSRSGASRIWNQGRGLAGLGRCAHTAEGWMLEHRSEETLWRWGMWVQKESGVCAAFRGTPKSGRR